MSINYDEALRLKKLGMRISGIMETLGINDMKVDTFQHILARYEKNGNVKTRGAYTQKNDNESIDIKSNLIKALEKGGTIEEMGKALKQSDRVIMAYIEDLKEEGYNVLEIGGAYSISKIVVPKENKRINNWSGERILRFGLCGDPQFNSKYVQISHLHNFYDILKSEGIEDVYNTGDLDEGEEMRPGHKYECYNQGADDHVKEIVKNYPSRDGMRTFFITGNHDHSIIKRCGYDIGIAIAAHRDDMVYLGQSSAVIQLTPNCTLELRHPLDGTAYAISYKMQKMAEAMSGGEKPNILAVGHYHKSEYLFYRNIHVIQTGCFQAQTNWMRGKQISAHMGGWIIEVHVNEEGTITRFKSEFIPYYVAIKDDYMNWR